MRIYRIQSKEPDFGCYHGPIFSGIIGAVVSKDHKAPSEMSIPKDVAEALVTYSFNYYFDSLDKLFDVFFYYSKKRCLQFFNIVYLDINDKLINNKTVFILEENQIAVRDFYSTENFKIIPWDDVAHRLKDHMLDNRWTFL